MMLVKQWWFTSRSLQGNRDCSALCPQWLLRLFQSSVLPAVEHLLTAPDHYLSIVSIINSTLQQSPYTESIIIRWWRINARFQAPELTVYLRHLAGVLREMGWTASTPEVNRFGVISFKVGVCFFCFFFVWSRFSQGCAGTLLSTPLQTAGCY